MASQQMHDSRTVPASNTATLLLRLAAYSLDVDFYGCELDTRYYEMQQERFERECLNIISLNGKKIKQPTLFDI